MSHAVSSTVSRCRAAIGLLREGGGIGGECVRSGRGVEVGGGSVPAPVGQPLIEVGLRDVARRRVGVVERGHEYTPIANARFGCARPRSGPYAVGSITESVLHEPFAWIKRDPLATTRAA